MAERIVAAAAVRPGQLVIDLGAGDGDLTEPLLATGCRVIAVELHEVRADRLRERLAGRRCSVLTLDVTEFSFPGRPCRVVANPPFAHTETLLHRLDRATHVFAVDLVLPRWVVRRYLRAQAGGARRRAGWRADEGLVVSPRAFVPASRSPCAVLQLRRR